MAAPIQPPPSFDPEVFGGDTCDVGQCCLNPFGFLLDKLSKSSSLLSCCKQPRLPTAKTLYLVVFYSGWTASFAFIYPAIDTSENVAAYHKIIGILFFVVCILSWRVASTSCPGNITATTLHQYDNYRYDNVLYVRKMCPTLHIQKLARSKYDRYSATHVPRFDHHCHVLNQSVGERNYRYFLTFLCVHCIMCWYGIVITLRVAWGQEPHHVDPIVNDDQPWWHFGIIIREPLILFPALLSAATIPLTAFFGFHCYLVWNGMTTNEYYKWKEIRLADAGGGGRRTNTGTTAPHQQQQQQDVEGHSSIVCLSPSTTTCRVNLYNLGVARNVHEVFFPRCSRNIKKRT